MKRSSVGRCSGGGKVVLLERRVLPCAAERGWRRAGEAVGQLPRCDPTDAARKTSGERGANLVIISDVRSVSSFAMVVAKLGPLVTEKWMNFLLSQRQIRVSNPSRLHLEMSSYMACVLTFVRSASFS